MANIRLNLFYNVLLNVSRVLFPLVTAPYVSRVLGPDNVGLYNFSNTYAVYFAMFALLGIPTHGLREVARNRENRENLSKVVSELVSITVILTAAVSFIYVLSLLFVDKLSNDMLIFLLAGSLLYLCPFRVDWFFSGTEDFGFITFRSLLVKVLSIAALFIFVKDRSDLLVYVIITALSNLLSDGWCFLTMRSKGVRVRLTLHGLKRHFKPALILFATAVAISVYTTLDVVMLGFLDDYSEVAFYNSATNISRSLLAVVTSVSTVALPRMSYYVGQGAEKEIQNLVDKSLTFVSFLAFPAAIGLACISPVFTPLFYGQEFVGAAIPLQIMAFIIVSIGFSNIAGVQILVGFGKDKRFLELVCIGAACNFLLNLYFIPHFGAIGASATSLTAETLIAILCLLFARKDTFVRFNGLPDIFKSMAGALLLIPLFLLERTCAEGWWLVGLYCISGFVLYIVLQWLFGNGSLKTLAETALTMAKKHLSKA